MEEDMFWADRASPEGNVHVMTRTGSRVPIGLKLAYTAYVAVLIPVYWYYYGPTNFLFFCDVALILTLIAIWPENAPLISICSVCILLPQTFWVARFLVHSSASSLPPIPTYISTSYHSLSLPFF